MPDLYTLFAKKVRGLTGDTVEPIGARKGLAHEGQITWDWAKVETMELRQAATMRFVELVLRGASDSRLPEAINRFSPYDLARPMPGLTILTLPQDTLPLAEVVAAEADTERDALGFLPESTYVQGCASGRLFVAIDDRGVHDRRYAGHVLFGGAGSEVHIYQLFVSARYRRRGIGRELIDALMHWGEARNFLGMAARVAADLDDANKAWDALGFRLVRKTRGGPTRGRTINLRHRELRTQGLLASVQSIGRDNITFSVPPTLDAAYPSTSSI